MLDQKFKRLKGCRAPAPGRWVKNLSSRIFTEAESGVLSKGLNFNVQGGVKNEEFLAATEVDINLMTCSDDEKQDARIRIVGALGRKKNRHDLTMEEVKPLAGLRGNRSIFILSSDKGRTTVVLNKEDYERKATTLLHDRNTYEVVPYDPTSKL
ncbi:uncharacterized protein LOC143019843 [Oratosquilla oratoria]|uniref:uncharacterized protein LOC143019843 n=1 Tax=Oratosquilla oratoria TaxID=337810 RepID=UPI003F77797B